MFINLLQLMRTGNIPAIFKVNQQVLISMSSASFIYKMKSLFFSHYTKNFRKHKLVSFKFCINFSAIKNNSSILFLTQALHTFIKSSLLKCKFLGFLSAKFVNFLMSILNWQVKSSSNFVSFFIAMTQISPVNLELINFLLLLKGSHQSSNF